MKAECQAEPPRHEKLDPNVIPGAASPNGDRLPEHWNSFQAVSADRGVDSGHQQRGRNSFSADVADSQ